MTRRPGATLIEAMTAIFIVMVGTLGVLAMFPVGSKWMLDAQTTDRATTHAYSIDALVRIEWKMNAVEKAGGGEPYWAALDDPGAHPLTTPANSPLPKVPPTSPEASYPVFLDPMGVFHSTANSGRWVGDPGAWTAIPRRTTNQIGADRQLALRMWSQADGFSLDEDGKPVVNYDGLGNPTTSAEMREWRYNALAVLQRPTNRDRYQATLKVVVFSNRRHLFFPDGREAVFPNAATAPPAILFTPTSTQIQLSTTADVKKGSWLMDATVQTANAPGMPTVAAPGQIRHANFYRVVSATDNGNAIGGHPVYDVELHTPIKRTDGKPDPFNATVVLLNGVLDVFERPVLVGDTN